MKLAEKQIQQLAENYVNFDKETEELNFGCSNCGHGFIVRLKKNWTFIDLGNKLGNNICSCCFKSPLYKEGK